MLTTAQEKINRAKELMSEAHKELLVVLGEDTHGYGELSYDYIDTLHQVINELFNLKRKF